MKRIIPVLAMAMAALFTPPTLAAQTSNPTNTTEQASSTATASAVVRTATAQITGMISSRVSSLLAPTAVADQGGNVDMAVALYDEMTLGTGISAGGGDGRMGVWPSGSWTDVEDDLSSTAYNGDVYNAMTGTDYQFNCCLTAGLALGYESSDINTTFNTGSVESSGWTIAPYAGYVLSRYFTVDVSAGYSIVDYDTTRVRNALTITGDFDSDRWFASGAINGYYSVNKILLNGRAGYSYAKESQDGFNESNGVINASRDVKVSTLRVGGTAAYGLGKAQPYVTATGVYDVQQTKVTVGDGQAAPSNDKSGVDIGGGVRISLSDRVTGGIEGTTHLARDNFESTTVSGNLRIKF
ncbi:MAG: autotransporter outer membrane beta-barrel domain-containing protein [Alphaproteobacteria bacterium]|nr:autotransporter outer membrane beta-barrel domain-containing protein [Alphaproteobacteria bacterium]MDP6236968.1 autotransporter outer membrane beta-barrel domain-containing protein [Alphaproteobacteria bacterium]MDP7233483.1 autotransporter outer membrane beta-barrel domain-containing protein [Alphaproteobacteria bacterium]MDP7486615.1 autotransporter outer membrane beta-barrel domain-containing protein [Alphaproteobacteria bacterium]HJN21818.1 autotransporter outer membrane beta-barrel dom